MRKRQELQWSFWKNLDFKYTATKKRITEEEQMEQKYQYNTVEEAIRDLQDGKIILVTDDPDRENEGDMICAAQLRPRKILILWQRMQRG